MSSLRTLAARCLLAPFRRRVKTVRNPSHLAVERLESRDNPAPVAAVQNLAAAGSTTMLLGDAVNYSFFFANTHPTDVGFTPFITLAVETSGPDGSTNVPAPPVTATAADGFGAPAVSAAGLSLSPSGTPTVLTAGQTTYVNPVTGQTLAVPAGYGAGDTLYTYVLPFGSFSPGQSTQVTASLPSSRYADVGTPLRMSVTPGYRDSDGNPNAPLVPLVGTTANTDATPELYRFRKVYIGPEDETATGPNFVRRYRLEVDIATGQTVNSLVLTDDLPSSMQIVGRTSARMAAFLAASGLGTNVFSAANSGGTAVTTAPDGTLTYTFGNVTGVAGVDAAFEFDFYVPRDTAGGPAVLPQTASTGTDSVTDTNTASTAGTWTPLDTRDAANQNVAKATPDNGPHTLEEHSLATQKSSTLVDLTSGNPTTAVRPGQTLVRYDLDFQVSDYYAFNNVTLQDLLGDGHRLFVGTFGAGQSAAPTLQVNNAFAKGSPGSRSNLTAAAFADPGSILYRQLFTSGADSDPVGYAASGPGGGVFNNLSPLALASTNPYDGSTFLQFNISQELERRLPAGDGVLVGGDIGNDGSGPNNSAFGSQPFGGTTGRITFYALITEEYSDAFQVANGGTGDPSVDQGDTIRNRVPLDSSANAQAASGGAAFSGIRGDQLAPGTINAPTPTVIGVGTDDTAASLVVPRGTETKSVYAINNTLIPTQTAADTVFSVQAGDRVTYKLTYDLPISRFEGLRLVDLPPLPVFRVGAAGQYTFDRTPDGSFNRYEIEVAPDDTFFSTFGSFPNPAVTTDQTENSVTMDFGDFDDVQDRSTRISLLITLPVGSDSFIDDLFLTNQLRIYEGSTVTGITTEEDLRRIELVRPQVGVDKGIVGFGGTGRTLGGHLFTAPNDPPAGASTPAFTGTVDTTGEADAIGGANVAAADGVDAGDRVRYAIVAQNTGRGDAFNVVIEDQIQPGYVIPPTFAGLNLNVRRGDGTLLSNSAEVQGFARVATTGALTGGGIAFTTTAGGTFSNVTRTIDGMAMNLGDLVLVKDQLAGLQNGVYLVSAVDQATDTITLVRAPAFDTAGELSSSFIAVMAGTSADRYFQASAVPTLNVSLVLYTLQATTQDYYAIYDATTGAFRLLLSDNYTAGNVNPGGQSLDDRSGGLSRGESVPSVFDGDNPTATPITNGSNTVVVQYDLVLAANVAPNQSIVNTARVANLTTGEESGDLTDPAVVPGATEPSDTATAIVALPQQTKTLVGTSHTATGNAASNQATLGEFVTYELVLTIPEGATPGADVFDQLDEGLEFIDILSVTLSSSDLSSSNGLTFANNGAVNATTLTGNTAQSGSNNRAVTFTLGTLTNLNRTNGTGETITIRYRARVRNVNSLPGDGDGNQAGDLRNNSARLRWTNNAATLATVSAANVTVVEPTLTNVKDVAVQSAGTGAYSAFGQSVRADAGDNIRYRITLTNGSAATDTTAYDVSLSDQLPTAFFVGGAGAFGLVSVTTTGSGQVLRNGAAHTLTLADFAITAGVLTLNTAFTYDFEPNVSVAVEVQGTNFTGAAGVSVNNVADLRWTSLPGVVTGERTGADGEGNGLNNYADADNAVIESPPVVRKTIVATSETHTTGANVAAGEVVRYRLVVSVPEGSVRNGQIQDVLPTGLSFLNDGTARWAFVSTGGNVIGSTGITDVTGLGTPTVGTGGIDGNQTTLATLTSAQLLGLFNDNNISLTSVGAGTGEGAVYADGADVFFRFGDLSNTDNDADAEYIVIEFNALVLNVTGNQAGATRNNTMAVLADTDGNGSAGYIDVVTDANGDGLGSGEATTSAADPSNNASGTPALSAPVTVTVVEPAVTVAKAVIGATTGDSGDTITFEIVLTAGSGANTATAFDVAFADLVPSGFENVAIVGGSLTSTGTVTGLGAVGVSGSNVTLGVGSMAPGATVTFRFTATINDNGAAAPAPGSTLTNTGSVTFTSLPGGTGTTVNPTGSATPGAAGSGTGERTGADGVGGALNDYAATDPADVTLNSHSLSGQVYYDANNNGTRDGAEVLITDSTTFRLTGTDVAGNTVDRTVTTTTGVYSFTGLRAGTYTVTQLDQPTGYLDGRDTPGTSSPGTAFGGTGTATTDDRGTPTAPGRDADAINSVVIGGGADSKAGVNYNFGELLPAQLGNLVFLDQNGNGRQDGGTEVGIDGVSVVLTGTDDTGRAVNVTATTAAGTYQFTNLRPGTYTATFGTSDGTTTYARTVRDSAVATDATDSDGDPATGTTGSYTLANGDSNQTVDQGLFVPVSLGDRVYFDYDADGVQDAGEPGIEGAVVTVVWHGPDGNFGGGDDQTFTITTGANGLWSVGNLPPGTYRVTSTLPAAYTLTDSLDNGGAPNSTNPVTVGTTSGVDRTDIDFGYRGNASLGDRVYIDQNGDGVQNANEPGLPGVTVTLRLDANNDGDFNDAEDGVFTTVTGTNGTYLFPNLVPGNYQVSVPAAGNGGVPDNMTLTDSLDDGALNATATVTTNIAAGEDERAIDFGYQGNASLGDRVWYDADGDGVQDANEPGIAGATVTLTWFGANGISGGGDDVTFTTTTDANGNYLFSGIPANALSGANPNYRVAVTPPAAYPTLTDSLDNGALSPVNPADVQVSPVEGNPLNDRRDVDFGYRGTASLGNLVWLDANGNGRQDGGTEVGIDGVTVSLLFDRNGDGDFLDTDENLPLLTTTTAGGGLHAFNNLAAGNYQVVFGASDGTTTYARTVRDSAVATDATDSDGDPATGTTGSYTLANGDSNQTVDQGLYVPVTIGDRVWYDTDGDGTQDPAESTLGVPGVVLVLDYAGPDGAFDESGDVIGQFTATTDASGNYSFTNLPPGTYRVRVQDATVPVPSLAFTTAGGNTQDSVTTSGVSDPARDFGVRGSGTVGDTIFLDVDDSGTPGSSEAIQGVRVFLTGDLDGDGTVEANETLTATTNASGQYLFTGLRTTPGGVPYTVTVDTTTVPQVGGVAPANTVDPNGGNDSTSAVSLTDGTPNNLAQDFGYRNTAVNSGSIGDTVFLDVDGDGTADTGEGVTGVRVTLAADIDGNGVTETFTATTDAAGNYRFDGLPFTDRNGNTITYTVTVNTADLPAGVTNTTDPDGGNDSTSSLTLNPADPINLLQDFGYRGDGSIGDTVFLDLNNNGTADAGEGITGVTVVLTADVNGDGLQDLTVTATTGADGEYLFDNLPVNSGGRPLTPITYTVRVTGGLPTGVSNTVDPDGTTDSNWAGTLATGPAAPDRRDIDFGYRGTGRLGDRVWLDVNGDGVQDATSGEPSLPNVGFTLTYAGQDGVFGNADDITTTLTAGTDGRYTFDHLPAGTFRVTVNTATLPGNVTPTFDLDGTGTPHAADATLTTGQARTDVDFGYRGAAGLGDRVWLDQNRNGVQDPGEGGIPGAVVRLVLAGPDGLMSTADDINFTATTGTNGVYTFGGLPVYGPSSDFRVTVVSLPTTGLDAVGDLDSPAGSGDQAVFGGLPANQTRTDVDFGYAGRGRIAGVVFEDTNNDGVRQTGDPAIPGTVLVLDGTDVFGNPLRDPLTGGPLTATADANGEYAFPSLPPGTYSVREVQPAGYLDGTDTLGSLGGVLDPDRVTQIVLPADGSSVQNNFAEIRPAVVAGTVYEDRNNNGRQDPSEPGIPGVRVVLTGTDDRGPVALTLTTDANGNYRFPDLRPGTYTLTQTQPALFNQGQNTVGTGGGALAGRDVIQSIVLVPAQNALEYRFGEIVRAVSPTPTLPVETVQPWETSKRMFLSSTTSVRTDSVPDFAALGSMNSTRPIQFSATGDDVGGSRVRVYDLTNGRERFRFEPFAGFQGGVRTAVGDMTGDGIPDVVAAAGPGGGPHVIVYNGDTGGVVQSFFAFEPIFRGGSFVATGDFDGDGTADLAVAADQGGGPRVRVFRSGNPAWVMSDFWGIEDMNFRGGARVAAGDVNGDGRDDLVVAAGFGGGPRVAVYDGGGIPTNRQNKFVGDFFAFEPTFFGGVHVTVGDVNGDGFAEVIAGAGEGGGPRVRALSGREMTGGRVTTVTDQFAFDLNGNAGGARVAATDLDGDGLVELFVGTGPGVRPVARFFNPRTGLPLDTFSPNWENTINGVFVG